MKIDLVASTPWASALKAGMVSSEVKTKALVVTPPRMPWMMPPATQPTSMRG